MNSRRPVNSTAMLFLNSHVVSALTLTSLFNSGGIQ